MTNFVFDPVRHLVAPDDEIDVIVGGKSAARFAVRVKPQEIDKGAPVWVYHVSFERVDILPPQHSAAEAVDRQIMEEVYADVKKPRHGDWCATTLPDDPDDSDTSQK